MSLDNTNANPHSCSINTWNIFNGEFGFWADTSSERWAEYSLAYAQSFENLVIQNFKSNAPFKIAHLKEYDKFLRERTLSFFTREKPETPIDDLIKEESEISDDQKNIFSIFSRLLLWTEDFIVLRENNGGDFFEVMFAFYLRQCNVTMVYEFLDYQLQNNFKNEKKNFLRFLRPLVNKYQEDLFYEALTKTTMDWIEAFEFEVYNQVSSVPSIDKLRSFKLKDSRGEENLINVLDGLKKNDLVASDTTLTKFKKLFRSEKIINPVVWKGGISELHYFVKCFHLKSKKIEPLNKEIWKVTANCFIRPLSEKFHWK